MEVRLIKEIHYMIASFGFIASIEQLNRIDGASFHSVSIQDDNVLLEFGHILVGIDSINRRVATRRQYSLGLQGSASDWVDFSDLRGLDALSKSLYSELAVLNLRRGDLINSMEEEMK